MLDAVSVIQFVFILASVTGSLVACKCIRIYQACNHVQGIATCLLYLGATLTNKLVAHFLKTTAALQRLAAFAL